MDPERPDSKVVAAVVASYARCRERGAFVEAFYYQLWARDSGIAARFEGTDMAHQQEVMRDGLNTLLMYAKGSTLAGMALDRIAWVHSREVHDVSPRYYDLFVDALVDTAKVWDSEWSEELEQGWRAAMAPGIERMITRY